MPHFISIELPADARIVHTDKRGLTITVELPPSGVAYSRALWVKSYVADTAEDVLMGNVTPKDGKGFLIGMTSKLTLG